jgi:hypothetical protein
MMLWDVLCILYCLNNDVMGCGMHTVLS